MVAESTQQFLALKQRSQQIQTALDGAHAKLQGMEEELADFLDDYYAQVGRDFETLNGLREELKAVGESCFSTPSSRANEATPTQENRATMQQELKGFYREMARECHPDVAVADGAHDMAALKDELMKTLNYAYARKNLSEMWKIKWELERQKNDGQLNHKQRLQLLSSQQDQMQRALDDLQQRESEIRDSAAYQLMQHARLMKLCGQDFIALVRDKVRAEITQTKKQLVSARIQNRYWQHVKMQPAPSRHDSANSA